MLETTSISEPTRPRKPRREKPYAVFRAAAEFISRGFARACFFLVQAHLQRHGRMKEGFYNPESYPWVNLLQENYPTIRSELDNILPRVKTFATSGTSQDDGRRLPERAWRQYFFLCCGETIASTSRQCPETAGILARIPTIRSATFSLLFPNTKIASHRGAFKGLVRHQFALEIPGTGTACGIKVDGTSRAWQEGEIISFHHSHTHETWNNTDEIRVVLLFDVERNDISLPWSLVNKLGLFFENRTRYARETRSWVGQFDGCPYLEWPEDANE